MKVRKILHCDLNNFYASVECKYHPELRHVPMAVGGDQEARRGVVLAKNQLAKQYGIITGEPLVKARQKCPGLVVAPAHRELYTKYSMLSREIYTRYTDKVESFGIDECWLDVTDCHALFGNPEEIAERLRKEVKEELGLTISIGVSFNKVFAKLGSDMKKPDAITVIPYNRYKEIVWPLPVKELLYVGKNTAGKLNAMGIYTIGDLARCQKGHLEKLFGKLGNTLYVYANGQDDSPVVSGGREVINRSIGNSVTTAKDLKNNQEVRQLLYEIGDGVAARIRKSRERGYTVQIVVKDTDLHTITRQARLANATNSAAVICEKAYEIFLKNWDWSKRIRMLGITVSELQEGETVEQLSLLEDPIKTEKQEKLEQSMDQIRNKYGTGAVKRGI